MVRLALFVEVVAGLLSLTVFRPASCLDCQPEKIRTVSPFDLKRFIGRWHVAGRHDEGLVEDFRWNEECIVSMTLRTAPYPAWFNHPRGNHSLQIDSIGRDEMGVCRGVHYKWGELTEELPGFYKYKLVGAMHYSLLYVIATDYEDYAVLGVCESKINQEQLRFYCHTLTILLLLRQLPDNGYAVDDFDVNIAWANLRDACHGELEFLSNQRFDMEDCELHESLFPGSPQ